MREPVIPEPIRKDRHPPICDIALMAFALKRRFGPLRISKPTRPAEIGFEAEIAGEAALEIIGGWAARPQPFLERLSENFLNYS